MYMVSAAAAAATKSLQLCPTLCDPIDGSPPGSAIPGILQAGLAVRQGFLFLFFLPPCNLWDLGSPARDQALSSAVKVWSPNRWTAREF